jgi:uncharacterized protein YndB with AHSA1/START domain
MASIRKEFTIDASPDEVWSAVRDWGALHERLVPGFVTDVRLDGTDRIVTFFTGVVAREVFVDLDDDARRLVWSVVDGPFSHDNASAQVFEHPGGRTRFLWTNDFLPSDEELVERIDQLMERGAETIKQTMEASAGRGGSAETGVGGGAGAGLVAGSG